MMPSTSTATSVLTACRPLAPGDPRSLCCGLQRGLDPVGALHAFGRVHLVGRVLLHLHEGELPADGLRHAVDGPLDWLVALPERHLDRAARGLEGEPLERGDDLV